MSCPRCPRTKEELTPLGQLTSRAANDRQLWPGVLKPKHMHTRVTKLHLSCTLEFEVGATKETKADMKLGPSSRTSTALQGGQ